MGESGYNNITTIGQHTVPRSFCRYLTDKFQFIYRCTVLNKHLPRGVLTLSNRISKRRAPISLSNNRCELYWTESHNPLSYFKVLEQSEGETRLIYQYGEDTLISHL